MGPGIVPPRPVPAGTGNPERLKYAADRNLVPDLNDGVVLTIAPPRERMPWAEAKRYWQELQAGTYE